ncbi:ABC-type oligopeptide transport system, ATPase component [Rothia mucilaginosa DY-18]|uniref:ABC-type oligopeptide transport system, ATPase component n=2 Tax=Rothia mucilaginosa TaxID=43675 RepID=D2NT16_ROTMD|nr:ABC-type oligopeptide transport system, ATPase component [Rothia mucilaginosa DY-18]
MRGHKFAILLASLPLFISQTVSYAGEAPFNSYSECAATNPNSASVCEQIFVPKDQTESEDVGLRDDGHDTSGGSTKRQEQASIAPQVHEWEKSHNPNGFDVYSSKNNPGVLYCVTPGGKVGIYKHTNLSPETDAGFMDRGRPAMGLKSPTSANCIPSDIKAVQDTKSKANDGPTWEQMMAQIIEAAQSLEPGKPTLHQSYNNPAGTGRAEGDPNVYKGDQINFYVDDGGPYRLEADMLAGHVEIELMPSSYVIEYGNGDTDTNYTAGKPVTTYPRERPRQTDTSYAYQRSGNFHAYATVHYTARFRVDGGPWQMMMVTPQATSDPLLVRVWWVDVGRVAGDCSYDDTRWGCKNDPTMGKKDNPNPRLRKADIRTGQRWHLNDSGDGDTEYSLHRDWPDM